MAIDLGKLKQCSDRVDSLTKRMDAVMSRAEFDVFVERTGKLKMAELKAEAKRVMGYEPYERTKGEVLKHMKRWHRQSELNEDRTRAQSKIAP